MRVVTRGIILSRGTDIATCQNRDLTRGSKKILQKKLKKILNFFKKIKKKLKKRESDTWPAVNGVNYFFLTDALFQKWERN